MKCSIFTVYILYFLSLVDCIGGISRIENGRLFVYLFIFIYLYVSISRGRWVFASVFILCCSGPEDSPLLLIVIRAMWIQ